MSNKHNTIISLKSNQITAIEAFAPDYEPITDWLYRLAQENFDNIPVYSFSLATNLVKYWQAEGKKTHAATEDLPTCPPGDDPFIHYLEAFHTYEGDGIFIIKDLAKVLAENSGNKTHISYLQLISTAYNKDASYTKRLVILGEHIDLPSDLQRLIPKIQFGLPNRANLQRAIEQKLANWQRKEKIDTALLTQAALGLTGTEVRTQLEKYYQSCCLLNENLETETAIEFILTYKTQLLKNMGIDVVKPDKLEIGGHHHLKAWLAKVEQLLKPEARQYGLDKPKGCFLFGVSGCGKTLVAKTIANKWNLPLIKLSMPSLKGSLVGESESNLRKALLLIENLEGVVLLDELEKAISGMGTDSSGVSGGMGAIALDWMQEQTTHFVIATANDIEQIPSEMLRSGRLDKQWFVPLPKPESRAEILKIHLLKNNRCEPGYLTEIQEIIELVVKSTEQYSGAELEQLVKEALTSAYLEDRPRKPKRDDFMNNIFIPLAITHKQKYQKIMEWSKNAVLTE